MSRASTYTWLPLDRWAEILGLSPLHFNQFTSEYITSQSYCGDVWYQYNWQGADKTSREEIAFTIKQAEDKLSEFVGFNLIPDWEVDERQRTKRPISPELFGGGYQPRWTAKSITADKGYIITGGIQAKELIDTPTVVRTDEDGDGYKETVTATVVTTVTSEDEIRVYFPGEDGADEWEIRPLKKVTISGGTATIVFRSWQIPDPDVWESMTISTIDGDDDGNYITTVDVYRVYNDPSQMVQFLWEGIPNSCGCGDDECAECAKSSQYGCLSVRDERLGFFMYRPATYDEDTGQYVSACWSVDREPESMRLWYLSGWQNKKLARPLVTMDSFWEHAVAYYAASMLERPICGCNNAAEFVKSWMEDLARVGTDHSWQITSSIQDNTFGSRRGAVYAFQRAKDKRIAK